MFFYLSLSLINLHQHTRTHKHAHTHAHTHTHTQAFRRIYIDPIVTCRQPDCSAEEKTLGRQRAAELNKLISLFCLRRTKDVNNKYLPPKHDTVVICSPTPLQLQIYKALISSRTVQSCLAGGNAMHLVCFLDPCLYSSVCV